MEHYFDEIVKNKIKESIAFFKNTEFKGVDEKLLGLLISAQFDSYRRIVTICPDRKIAEKYIDSLMVYYLGGWVAFFESVAKRREDT